MTVTDRFLKYAAYDTQSDENSNTTPSTSGQRLLAQTLKSEMEAMGFLEISLDDNSYLMATLPANTDENIPTIGFIAHLDTSPDVSGANVNPRIINNNEGEEIIVSDGTTLLGADDKAGIAEIMTAVQFLLCHPEIKHGKVRIAFTPDEEIGRGADKFDVEKFGCTWAYTVDGGELGELEYENFNAAAAKIKIRGLNFHPGTAKGKMLNALHIAMQFAAQLPATERPETTEGYEGFFHLTEMKGTVENAELSYIIRDHDAQKFENRLKKIEEIKDCLNILYPKDTVSVEVRRQYRNMREIIELHKHIVGIAERAVKLAGITPKIIPIRGGTDGAQLSFKGLPCPNIFTGGLNFHSRHEFIPVKSMEKAVEVIVNIIAITGNSKFY
jgi:tripeptide aminopeptidase